MSAHPVIAALRASGMVSETDLAYIERKGRPYVGQRLPIGVRQRPAGTEVETALELEGKGHGEFVRGYGVMGVNGQLLAHSWVSPDGRAAIDAVWSNPPSCSYWGVPRMYGKLLAGTTRKDVFTVRVPSFAPKFSFSGSR